MMYITYDNVLRLCITCSTMNTIIVWLIIYNLFIIDFIQLLVLSVLLFGLFFFILVIGFNIFLINK